MKGKLVSIGRRLKSILGLSLFLDPRSEWVINSLASYTSTWRKNNLNRSTEIIGIPWASLQETRAYRLKFSIFFTQMDRSVESSKRTDDFISRIIIADRFLFREHETRNWWPIACKSFDDLSQVSGKFFVSHLVMKNKKVTDIF